jgi:hypothetical protein
MDAVMAWMLYQLAIFRRNQQKQEAWASRTQPSLAYPNASLADVPVPSDSESSETEPQKPRIKPRSLRSTAKLQVPNAASELHISPDGKPTKSTLALMYDPLNQLRPIDTLTEPWLVALIHLWNPLSLLTCISQSTVIFNSVCVVSSLYFASKEQKGASMLSLAAATYQTIYPVMLLGACVLLLDGRNLAGSLIEVPPTDKRLFRLSLHCTFLFVAHLAALFSLSHSLVKSWNFIPSTYGIALSGLDLQPNLGLWWYIMIEMFDPFRNFFIGVFQMHLLLWFVPMTIRFRFHPLLAATLLCTVTAIFKPYPTLGDVALYLSLLPLHAELLKCTFLKF